MKKLNVHFNIGRIKLTIDDDGDLVIEIKDDYGNKEELLYIEKKEIRLLIGFLQGGGDDT